MLLHVCVMLSVASQLSFGRYYPSLDEQWEQWKSTYRKQYKDDIEEEERRSVWTQNLHMIDVHNQEAKQGKHSYTLGMNQYGDRNPTELPAMMTFNRTLRHILRKIEEKMLVLNQESRNEIWQKINKNMAKYNRILRNLMLKRVEADMDEDDPWVSSYNMLTDLDLVVAEYNEILRRLIVDDVYEQMVEHSMTSSDLILQDIAEIITWSKTISVYQAKLPEQSSCNQKSEQCLWSERNSSSLPTSIDYREKGLVTPVKNQGNCGSCWAFSAAGALEAQLAKKAGWLVELSPQNLVDCDKKNNGCDGGFADFAFEHVQGNGYVFLEEDYPYVGEKQRCRNKPFAVPVQCRGFEWIPEGDEHALAEALHEVGPLSVLIDASDKTIPFYKSGVYYNPACNNDTLSHAMLLVGYGETATGQKYWTVKNSWGTGWGEDGYIRIARNRNNHCGIASDASYPLL